MDFKRRNNSLGAQVMQSTAKVARREYSGGTLASDLKKAFLADQRKQRKHRVEDARNRTTQLVSKKLAESVMMEFSNVEPSHTAYNVLGVKYTQFQDKANIGWRTERSAKDFSIKKNSHDWLQLKDRLSQTKQRANLAAALNEDVLTVVVKPSKVQLLSEMSKIERDAVKWLGDDSRLLVNDEVSRYWYLTSEVRQNYQGDTQ